MRHRDCLLGIAVALAVAAGWGWYHSTTAPSSVAPVVAPTPRPNDGDVIIPPRGTSFSIVDLKGRTILASDQIESYHWPTHTITLRPGARFTIHPDSRPGGVHGDPFLVLVDDEPCYIGWFMINISSVIRSGHEIRYNDGRGEDGELRITHFAREGDPGSGDARSNGRIRAALQFLGKLRE